MIMLDLDKLKQDEHGQETFEEGQIIISEGDVSDNKMYVLLDGVANVYKGYGTQGEIKIAELQPGDFFGEMSLFLNKERTATIIAGTEVSAIVVNNMSINDFLIRQPEAAYVFMQTLCKRLDITNINSSELQTTANTDALTGVYNRRFFMDSAKSLIAAASRNEKISYVILFDIDFFKKVNDTYGHQAGDDVLKEFASVANTNVRSGDLFARYGGEEFIMLISCDNIDGAKVFVERLRQNVEDMVVHFEDLIIKVTTSAGVAAITSDSNLTEVIALADQALYKAKNEGRNCVIFHE